DYSTQLAGIAARIKTITTDSTLRNLPADAAVRLLYLQQLNELKAKWQSTDSLAGNMLVHINELQTRVSKNYIKAVQLQNKLAFLSRNFWGKALGKEHKYLWEGGGSSTASIGFQKAFRIMIKANANVLSFYFSSNRGLLTITSLLFILFFGWLYLAIRRIKRKSPDAASVLGALRYVQPFPLLAALIFICTVAPFLDLHPPAIYVGMLQLILVISLTILLALKWPRKLFFYCLTLFILFEILAASNLFFTVTFTIRTWLLVFTIASVVFGSMFYPVVKKNAEYFAPYIRPLTIFYIALNLASLLCNILGRVTLAELLETTAVFNFVLAIAMMICIRIILELVYLQLEANKVAVNPGFIPDYKIIEIKLKRVLTLLAGVLWSINLTQNLNIYDSLYTAAGNFLNADRVIGNTSFTFKGVLFFFFVIWLAFMLQKYLGILFGGNNEELLSGRKNRFGTSILLIRLVIIIAGVLLGVAASGLPVDRITVVLGALGVGVGLGLQGVVNQLVSGIILAFEKPIQVGDTIEVGAKSGRVKEIGIRSSKLVTSDGAQVIVPNADLLTQNLINWTINNNHIRIEIVIKLEPGADIALAKKIITDLLANHKDVMKRPEPSLLLRSITQTGTELQILFWAYEMDKWLQLKSEIWLDIYDDCHAKGINLV
ncbi:MAG TPA: mechanosensitive ion channel domain-containing protein, partial [Chitinophagaceae bacterium]